MRYGKTVGVLMAAAGLAACVTINVYFPAAAAEKAADKFTKEVYGEDAEAKPKADQPQAPEPQSRQFRRPTRSVGGILLDVVIPPAHAQANIDISSPAIQALKSSMKQRQGQLRPYYSSGAVGMTNDGLITLRDAGAVSLAERNRVRQLVAAENKDRNALYAEVARANGHPEWEAQIRATFAESWVANAPAGWWYQDSNGKWKQK